MGDCLQRSLLGPCQVQQGPLGPAGPGRAMGSQEGPCKGRLITPVAITAVADSLSLINNQHVSCITNLLPYFVKPFFLCYKLVLWCTTWHLVHGTLVVLWTFGAVHRTLNMGTFLFYFVPWYISIILHLLHCIRDCLTYIMLIAIRQALYDEGTLQSLFYCTMY